ncbi:glycine betaine ABC transporter substrate-binding protein [Streptomyces sp. NPDC049687]|uniref:glycine betaine ABC transporter substrate-binding protein n=1 Tax=Streptomyces sp. NPDC049687 TaxID=3365596 RepID=UPI00379C8C62
MSSLHPPLRALVLALTLCSLLALSACGTEPNGQGTTSVYADAQGPAVIGTDSSAESRVMAALYGELLTAAGVEVRTATTVYASPVDTARAVVEGEIGLAPAYESTLLRALPGGQTMPGDMAATLSMALPPGIVALPPAAAERGVVLAVTRATARRHGLSGLTDLGGTGGRLTLGGSASGDPDAPTAGTLKKAYGVTLTPADTSATADVLVLRGTDPVIARDHLVVLSDPDEVVPPEHVFPLAAAPYAGLAARKALARVNSELTTGQLAALTSSVAAGETPARAARNWLRSEGLLG